MEALLKAIIDPNRRRILSMIQDKELPAGRIAAQFDLTRPAVSQHLKVLAQSGLVSVRRQGTQRLYKVRPEGLQELKQFLASFWEENLERLAAAAEAEERGTRLNVNK